MNNFIDNRVIQDIKEKFELARSKYLLCKYERAFRSNDFVQVVLKVISEEADIIGKIDDRYSIFNNFSKDRNYFVKFNNFEEYIYSDDVSFSSDFDSQIDDIEKYMQNKLAIIKPYYYYNQTRDEFFKNGTIVDIIDVNKQDLGKEFYNIPIIPNADSFSKFINGEPFSMPNVSKEIMGMPRYLYYDNKIYKATIDALENDVYWQDESKSSVELNTAINVNLMDENDEILKDKDNNIFKDKYNSFIFANCEIINSSKSKRKALEKLDESQDKGYDDSIEYDDSDDTKTLNKFMAYASNLNLCYSKNDIYNFYTCVRASQLIILAGMSGTGKTKLPLKFAEFFNMSEKDGTLLFIPVSPSYT